MVVFHQGSIWNPSRRYTTDGPEQIHRIYYPAGKGISVRCWKAIRQNIYFIGMICIFLWLTDNIGYWRKFQMVFDQNVPIHRPLVAGCCVGHKLNFQVKSSDKWKTVVVHAEQMSLCWIIIIMQVCVQLFIWWYNKRVPSWFTAWDM